MAGDRPQLSLLDARRIAIAAQGLDGSSRDLVDCLEATGFVRTLGGVDVYLALHARVAGFRRADLDTAVARRQAQVLPSARGCIYLVPGSAASDALRLADHLTTPRAAKEHEKAGIEAGELDAVAGAVLEALAEGPLATHALRRALPEGTVRSLGAAGKKVGLSSTLPPALRRLEFDRRVVRRLEGERLDSERYLWAPADGEPPKGDFEAVHRRLAEIFLRAAGLATRKAFAAWSGLRQAEARAALQSLDTVEVDIEGQAGPHHLLAARGAWLDAPPAGDAIAFLPFEDNLLACQQGPAFWVDVAHHDLPVPVWGRGRGSTLGDARHSALRPVIAGGRMVGFWEYDPDAEAVVTAIFDPPGAETRRRIDRRAEQVGAFLRDDLGHGRSFSLDTDEALRRRVAELRQMR